MDTSVPFYKSAPVVLACRRFSVSVSFKNFYESLRKEGRTLSKALSFQETFGGILPFDELSARANQSLTTCPGVLLPFEKVVFSAVCFEIANSPRRQLFERKRSLGVVTLSFVLSSFQKSLIKLSIVRLLLRGNSLFAISNTLFYNLP